jgi:hypothetical protein
MLFSLYGATNNIDTQAYKKCSKQLLVFLARTILGTT